MTGQVGVRALQQHASKVIRQVTEGQVVAVTDRGRLVAHLIPAGGSHLEVLAAAGLARTARLSPSDLADPLDAQQGAPTLSELLDSSRAHER
jgi:prevent-host-death family protein